MGFGYFCTDFFDFPNARRTSRIQVPNGRCTDFPWWVYSTRIHAVIVVADHLIVLHRDPCMVLSPALSTFVSSCAGPAHSAESVL